MTEDDFRKALAAEGKIALIWSVEDVHSACEMIEAGRTEGDDPVNITDDEAMEILQQVERDADASAGVNWDTLIYAIEAFIAYRPEPAPDVPGAVNGMEAVLDMYYGIREEWRDPELPPGMNVQLADPEYIEHLVRTVELADSTVRGFR